MLVCPTCREYLHRMSDRYCYKDGSALVADPPCMCGRDLNRSLDRYCPACGLAISVPDVVKAES